MLLDNAVFRGKIDLGQLKVVTTILKLVGHIFFILYRSGGASPAKVVLNIKT